MHGARDPDAALEIARREEPQAAIVDGMLGPGRRTGYDLVIDLKRELPDLRAWMLSGSASQEYRDLALRVGAEDLLEKPVLYSELTRAIFGHAEYAPEDSIHAVRTRHVENVMRACDGNKSEAARCLGVPRSAFQKSLKKTWR
jgi:ActR/RegA family two-component response regulator